MITIHFDAADDTWYHQTPHQSWTWGHRQVELPFRAADHPSITFSMCTFKGKAGPLIGWLTSKKAAVGLNDQPTGHMGGLYQAVQQHGGLLVVFTPEDMDTSHIQGKIYHPNTGKWINVWTPLPDVIYNRFPGRKREKTGSCRHILDYCRQENVPCFNPHFFSKWDLHQLFVQHPLLKNHLPETCQYENALTIDQMLKRHPTIYIKPAEGSKGTGVYRVSQTPEGSFLAETIKTSRVHGSLEEFIRTSFFNKHWLIQEAIPSDVIDEKKYDLRIIAVKSEKKHEIKGIGVRQSITQDVTTHVPSGGRIIPLSHIQQDLNLPLINRIVEACGQMLEEQYGLIGEFSMDMAKSAEGHYYMLELNSKPMIFDEADIQEQRIAGLISLFYRLSHLPCPLTNPSGRMLH
jgi:hypothetical protein